MNIKQQVEKTGIDEVSVSQQNIVESEKNNYEEVQQQQIEEVFNVKSKQFTFDNGLKMGNLLSPISNLKFSLKYHDDISNNFEEFLNSVRVFISASGLEITQSDSDNLKTHYEKYSKNGRIH